MKQKPEDDGSEKLPRKPRFFGITDVICLTSGAKEPKENP